MTEPNMNVKRVLSYDFRKGFNECHFASIFGAGGNLVESCDGITIDSKTFTTDVPQGSNGWMNDFKAGQTYIRPVYVQSDSDELVFETKMAAAQFFANENMFPEAFANRLLDAQGDPRLCSGSFWIYDPDNHMTHGLSLSNHKIHVFTGRLPLGWPGFSGQKDFANCLLKNHKFEGGKGHKYDANVNNQAYYLKCCNPCDNVASSTCSESSLDIPEFCCLVSSKGKQSKKKYMYDKLFQQWREQLTVQEFLAYTAWCEWRNSCRGSKKYVQDWEAYAAYAADYVQNSDPQMVLTLFNTWNQVYTYDCYCDWFEYMCFMESYYAMNPDALAREAPAPASAHNAEQRARRTRALMKAREANVSMMDIVVENPVLYYDGGDQMLTQCIQGQYAAYLSMVEVAPTREQCDPLSSFVKLAIVYNHVKNVIRFLVDGQEVFVVNQPGHRLADPYNVINYGGYAEEVHSCRFLVSFGTTDFLDAALPSNFSRFGVAQNYIARTAFVQLQETDQYSQIYFNKWGQLEGVEPAVTFAVPGDDSSARLFGQGAIMTVKYLEGL